MEQTPASQVYENIVVTETLWDKIIVTLFQFILLWLMILFISQQDFFTRNNSNICKKNIVIKLGAIITKTMDFGKRHNFIAEISALTFPGCILKSQQ